MLENIEKNIKTWDWKWQSTWWDDSINIGTLISRIDNWYYQTKEVELSIDIIDLSTYSFGCPNLFEFLTHYKLVENADLSYPVIINQAWQIIDWRHRLCKAILEWKKTLKGVMILDSNII